MDYVLCSYIYSFDIYLKTFSIMYMFVKVHNMVETVKSTIFWVVMSCSSVKVHVLEEYVISIFKVEECSLPHASC
jgi:hypothetical protein